MTDKTERNSMIGVVGLTIALIAHSGAIFYWGGRLSANVEQLSEDFHQADADKEKRVRALEDALIKIAIIQEFVVEQLKVDDIDEKDRNRALRKP